MNFTVFSCGVFYERFARGGLGAYGIGASSNVFYQGSYLMDVENGTAEVVEQHSDGRPVHVTMTSVNDVARFVVAALDLDIDQWQDEFRMSGDRISVAQILQWAESIRGMFTPPLNRLKIDVLTSHRSNVLHRSHSSRRSERTSRVRNLSARFRKGGSYARTHCYRAKTLRLSSTEPQSSCQRCT